MYHKTESEDICNFFMLLDSNKTNPQGFRLAKGLEEIKPNQTLVVMDKPFSRGITPYKIVRVKEMQKESGKIAVIKGTYHIGEFHYSERKGLRADTGEMDPSIPNHTGKWGGPLESIAISQDFVGKQQVYIKQEGMSF